MQLTVNWRTAFLPLIALATLLGVTQAQDAETDGKQAIASQAAQILKRYCFRCHSGDGSDSHYAFDVRSAASLLEQDMIRAKDAAGSAIYKMLAGGRMPPRNQPHLPKPSADEAEIIRKWIDSGAAEFPKPERRQPFVTLKDNLKSIRDHFKSLAPEDRKSTRYFTLTNLWNNSDVDDAELRNTRAALSKVINSLSWTAAIVLPEVIDSKKTSGTVYAIDLNRLGWSRAHWQALVDAYPYALGYGSHEDPELRKIDAELVELAGRDQQLLHLRADWFISTATKPRLYHKLLYELVIPDLINRKADTTSPNNPKMMTDRDLEKFLKVNVNENIFADEPRIIRAAFVHSGISGQNRMIEMHRLGSGRVYWKSYDFLASNRDSILAEVPLGPVNGRNQFNGLAFKHDGGEIIFTLPNGLQGYLLSTGAGLRLDAGPIEIVGDSLRTSGTQAIVTGLSCIACHRHGMVEPPKDEIRQYSSAFGSAQERIEKIYIPNDDFNSEISKINESFMTKLRETMEAFLTKGIEPKPDFDNLPEPVAEVSRRFLLESLNIETVACELNEADPEALLTFLKRSSQLRGIGLNVLAKENGAIKRDAWESKATYSLMQEAARELGFTPR